MADLPEARFDSRHAFSSVGLDFCGPVHVRLRRRTEKRYILLVTCLATRAVHLELTPSLDTDSFSQWQSFVSSKRHPDRVKSDICVTSARHVENGDNWLLAGTRDHRRVVPPRGQDVAVLTAPAWPAPCWGGGAFERPPPKVFRG